MRIRPIDPRDTGWAVDSPSYRVHLWRRQAAPPGIPETSTGYESEAFEVDGADVEDVLAWAEASAGGQRTYTLSVVIRTPEGLGLVRIAGADPTAAHAFSRRGG